MKSKGKVMDHYLFNLKFTVSKTGLKTLYHVALIFTIYCITDMTGTVECQEIKVVWFLGSFHVYLFLNYVNQTTKRKKELLLIKNYNQIRSTGFP